MSSIHSTRQPSFYRFAQLLLGVSVAAAVMHFDRAPELLADDWLTWPSTYTHDPVTGFPTDQYMPPVQPIAPGRTVRSGFRHFRSTLQVGQSADNVHIVEQFGEPVVPYEEWRFPFRPYSVPYHAWGPPVTGGWGPQLPWVPGFPGGGFPGGGFPGGGFPGMPGPGFPGNFWNPGVIPLQPQYQGQPWFDGTYPSAPPLDPSSDQQFFYRPPWTN
jgi:hypothetical protein